jgi:LCP family protein required for cell wall assembly
MEQRPQRPERPAYTDETIPMQRPKLPQRNSRTLPPPPNPRRAPRRQRRIRIGRWIGFGVLAIILFVGVIGLLFYNQVNNAARSIVVPDARGGPAIATPLAGPVTVLLVGVDERRDNPQEGVRSDTIILARINGPDNSINLLSVPRDTLVDVRGFGQTKINAAYGVGYGSHNVLFGPETTPQQGGMALVAETVENLFRQQVRVQYTAQVNFEGFAKIIDALGGVTINVPKYILDEEYPTEDFQTMRVEFQPGPQRMDGARALIYARTRHGDSDFDRGMRQQQVIRAIVSELRQRGTLGQVQAIPGLLESLQGAVQTTFPIDRIDVLLGLAMLGSNLSPEEIGQVSLNPEIDAGLQQTGDFSLIWSEAGLQAALDAWNGRTAPRTEQAMVQVLNGTDVPGLATKISGLLEVDGFRMLPVGNAPSFEYAQTTIYDLRGNPATSRRLSQALRNAPVQPGPAPDGIETQADILVILGADSPR